MKFPGFQRKPAWQSKDAAVRRDAVERDDDAELVANLSSLARDDVDARVRIAAMKRLADPGIVQGIALGDADTEVRRQARLLWLDLLAGTHRAAPALEVRVRLLRAQDDNDLIEHVARRGREPALRREALQRATRGALIAERALDDTDADNRRAAVDRIDDEKILQRIADAARKSDKQIHRHARARIDALRLGRGDEATHVERARVLCERLERLVRKPGSDDRDDIAARWATLDATLPGALRERFRSAERHWSASKLGSKTSELPATPPADAHTVASTAADAMPAAASAEIGAAPSVDRGAIPPTVDDTDADPRDEATAAPPDHAAADAISAAVLAKARFDASVGEADAARTLERDRHDELQRAFERSVVALDAAVDAGRSADAHPAKTRLDELRRQMNAPPSRTLAARAAAAENRYAEFSRWQHWADDQRRVQLCESVEASAAAALHPDAIASRVREAQAEWTRLDLAEGRKAGAHSGLSRRFHAACRAALAPAQEYFRKRQNLRTSHAADVEARLGQTVALNDADASPAALIAARRGLVEILHGLDAVDPRQRKTFAARIKAQLDALDVRIGAHDDAVALAKTALIAEAERLAQAPPDKGSIAQARDLQRRWQALGHGKRALDQTQWKHFRAALDGVFARIDGERAEREARALEARQRALAICGDMEALADGDVAGDAGALRQLQLAFDALNVRDDAVRERFDTARERVRRAAAQRQRAQRQARFEAWLERYAICRSAEQARAVDGDARLRWDAAAPTDIAAAILQRRFDNAAQSVSLIDDEPAQRDAVIELELLAGLASPAVDGERRRRLQLERLSARMGGGAALAPADELAQWLLRWSELGPAADASLDGRIEAAVRERLAAMP